MLKNTVVLFIGFITIAGCGGSKIRSLGNYSGVLETQAKIYPPNEDSAGGTSFVRRKWYKGYLSIEEVRTLYINTDTANHTNEKYGLNCYLFKNHQTGIVSEYLNFSDTAKLTQVFRLEDNLPLTGGAYYYGRIENEKHSNSKIYMLSDTIINGIKYKRAADEFITTDGIRLFDVFFFRCDKDLFFINLYNINDSLSSALNCLAVKVIRKPSLESSKIYKSSEILFLSDHLSEEELKVFEAWERNAKNNPVKK